MGLEALARKLAIESGRNYEECVELVKDAMDIIYGPFSSEPYDPLEVSEDRFYSAVGYLESSGILYEIASEYASRISGTIAQVDDQEESNHE